MKTVTYTIKDSCGIHARPAGLLVKEAQKMTSEIIISCNGKSAGLKKLFAVMGLGVKCGDTVELAVSGENENADAELLRVFLAENL